MLVLPILKWQKCLIALLVGIVGIVSLITVSLSKVGIC